MNSPLQKVKKLKNSRVFSDIDLEFCRFLHRIDSEIHSDVLFAAGLTSYAYREGNICISLDEQEKHPLIEDSKVTYPDPSDWSERVKEAKVVGRPGDYKPLILDDKNRLYLHKLWSYEQILAKNIIAKSQDECPEVNKESLKEGIFRLFDINPGETDWQAIATVAALHNYLTVISGGPGTGKTTTVVKILALLLEQYSTLDRNPSIALAAPTGKAAARLESSIAQSIENLNTDNDIKNQIPSEAKTLHQLLGARRNSSSFRYNEDNPLPYDIIIVDEASMVDQALMSRLMEALLHDARLILIGDKDQLASVEAGSVLGSICANDANRISKEFSNTLNDLSLEVPQSNIENITEPLTDAIILLEKSYRFKEKSGIPALAKAINNGQADKVLNLLNKNDQQGITFKNFTSFENFEKDLQKIVAEYFSPMLISKEPGDMFEKLAHFRLLSPHRRGPLGVEYLNQKVESILIEGGLISRFDKWYHGTPVIINQNEYGLGLNNGDIGICFNTADGDKQVLFQKETGFRKIAPSRLPDHSLAFALTVHKSQGSEFEHVQIILPTQTSKVL
ncbi:MAG: exodeoxyribonuclease V subunit alpha, partial [Candidatus Halalkalibacterium sp. M3_1C_030]